LDGADGTQKKLIQVFNNTQIFRPTTDIMFDKFLVGLLYGKNTQLLIIYQPYANVAVSLANVCLNKLNLKLVNLNKIQTFFSVSLIYNYLA